MAKGIHHVVETQWFEKNLFLVPQFDGIMNLGGIIFDYYGTLFM